MADHFNVTVHINELLNACDEQIKKALDECGLAAENFAKTNLTRQKAVDTGALRNSVTYEVDMSETKMIVGSPLEYAPYVELGTGVYVGRGRQTP